MIILYYTPLVVGNKEEGSGTTAYAATKLNRRSVLYEISAEYCALAQERNKQMGLGAV